MGKLIGVVSGILFAIALCGWGVYYVFWLDKFFEGIVLLALGNLLLKRD